MKGQRRKTKESASLSSWFQLAPEQRQRILEARRLRYREDAEFRRAQQQRSRLRYHKQRPLPEVMAQLASLFQRNGYVRRQNEGRLAAQGYLAYKKGDEIRLVANSRAELRAIRRLLRQAGFKPGRAFVKGGQWRQPVYGRAEVDLFLTLVKKATVTPVMRTHPLLTEELLTKLSPRRRAVLKLRTGCAPLSAAELAHVQREMRAEAVSVRRRSLRAVASLLGVSKERVRQLENRALEILDVAGSDEAGSMTRT